MGWFFFFVGCFEIQFFVLLFEIEGFVGVIVELFLGYHFVVFFFFILLEIEVEGGEYHLQYFFIGDGGLVGLVLIELLLEV